MADKLFAGQWLDALKHERITSANGLYTCVMQADGNLVIYYIPTWRALWSSNTLHKPVRGVVMQGDGNFVMYTHNGTPIWHTNTHDHPGAHIVMQSDGNLVVYTLEGKPVWHSDTHEPFVRQEDREFAGVM